MSGVTHQEDSALSELLGHQLARLPVCDVHDLYGEIRLTDSVDDKFLAPLETVVLRGFLLDQEHAAIGIGNQEKASDTWPIDEDRVIFIATDQVTPSGSKVDEDVVLIEYPQAFPFYTERFANVTVSAIGGEQIIGPNKGCTFSRAIPDGGAHSLRILDEGDQVVVVAHVTATAFRFCQQQRFETALRTIPEGRLWGEDIEMIRDVQELFN